MPTKREKQPRPDQIQCFPLSVEPYMKRCMAKLGWNLL